MIYTGSDEIRGIMLGGEEISAIYCGADLMYPMSVTAWSVTPSTLEYKLTGGTKNVRIASPSGTWSITSSENWITFSITGGGIQGASSRTVVEVTASNNGTGADRTATLTITDDDNQTTVGTISVVQYDCNPVVLTQHLGEPNNAGQQIPKQDFYLFDSGLTEVTTCDYDFTGIKSICQRWDGFYETTPVASLGNIDRGNNPIGCLTTLQHFEADCSTVEVMVCPFGNDGANNVCQTLTSATFYNTENIWKLDSIFYFQTGGALKSVKFGDMSNVTSTLYVFAQNSQDTAAASITDFEIDAFGDRDIEWGFEFLTALTVTSLVNILNALPQTSTSGRYIRIGSTNKNKLSAAQLQIATDKGWSVV